MFQTMITSAKMGYSQKHHHQSQCHHTPIYAFLPSIFHCSPWLHLRYWGWVCVAEESAHKNRMIGMSFFFNVIFLLIIWELYIMHSDHNHAPFLVLPGHPQHNLDLLSKKTKSNKKQRKKPQRFCILITLYLVLLCLAAPITGLLFSFKIDLSNNYNGVCVNV